MNAIIRIALVIVSGVCFCGCATSRDGESKPASQTATPEEIDDLSFQVISLQKTLAGLEQANLDIRNRYILKGDKTGIQHREQVRSLSEQKADLKELIEVLKAREKYVRREAEVFRLFLSIDPSPIELK